MNIEYVPHSLGNNFGNGNIELNVHLKDYPRLHQAILNHELEHTDKAFSKKDLILDLSETKVDRKELIIFMLKHPKSFMQFIPFYFSKKHGFVWDLNLCLIYLVFLICIGISVYIGFS